MAKMTPEKLAALQQHDKPAFDFNNPEISAFFERALPHGYTCLLYTSPSPRDRQKSRMPSSA